MLVESFVIVVSDVLVLSCGQTESHTNASERLAPAIVVGVRKYYTFSTRLVLSCFIVHV